MTTDRPEIREIVTKAVCGRGSYTYLRSIDLEVPVSHKTIQVLGSHISGSSLDSVTVIEKTKQGTAVEVKGRYDIHVWYTYDQDTKAAKTTVTFIEYIPIELYGGESITNPQALVEITRKPRCTKAHVKNLGDRTVIRVEIEQQFAAQVIGMTKLKVAAMSAAGVGVETVKGQELVPPPQPAGNCSYPVSDYYNLKCDEDLPEEYDDDYEYC